MQSGWNRLISLCCEDLREDSDYLDVENEPVLLKYLISKRLTTYYYIYRQWEKCWPLVQMEVKCHRAAAGDENTDDAAFDQYYRRGLTPTVRDCLDLIDKLPNIKAAYVKMMEISQLAQPSFIRLPGEVIDFQEPPFEPVYQRHPKLTMLVFLAIVEILNNSDCAADIESVIKKLRIYQRVFACFHYDFWPTYLVDELELSVNSSSTLESIFARLLKIEFDDINLCNPDLVSLFHFE